MSEFLTFGSSLIDNSVLLLVLLPLVGAGLVQVLAVTGRETVFFTALANVWLSVGLGGAMLFHFDAGTRDEPYLQPQMISSLRWLSGVDVHFEERPIVPDKDTSSPTGDNSVRSTQRIPVLSITGPEVRFVTGVNALSVWFVALIIAVTLVAIRSVPFDSPRLATRMSVLLVTESCLIGSFVAQDVLLLSFFWLTSSICLCLLIGITGQPERRVAARRYFSQQLVAGLFLTAGVSGLAVSSWWMQLTADSQTPTLSFSLNQISASIPILVDLSDEAREYWQSASPWLFVLLLAAAALRAGLPPFHHGWYRVCRSADRSTAALTSVGFLTSGFYLIARLVIPTFPVLCGETGSRMFLWGVLSALFVSASTLSTVRAVRRSDANNPQSAEAQWRRVVGAAVVVSLCVAIGVLFMTVPVDHSATARLQTESLALRGALLLVVGVVAAAALSLLIYRPLERAIENITEEECTRFAGGLTLWHPKLLRVISSAASTGFAFMPAGGAFVGLVLLLLAVFRKDSLSAILIVISVACVACSVRQFRQTSLKRSVPAELPSLASFIPLLAIILLTIVRPELVAGETPAEAVETPDKRSENRL